MPLDRNPHGSPLALMTVTLSTNMRQAGEGWCRLRNTHASWKFAYSYMQRIDWIASDSESPESGSSAMRSCGRRTMPTASARRFILPPDRNLTFVASFPPSTKSRRICAMVAAGSSSRPSSVSAVASVSTTVRLSRNECCGYCSTQLSVSLDCAPPSGSRAKFRPW